MDIPKLESDRLSIVAFLDQHETALRELCNTIPAGPLDILGGRLEDILATKADIQNEAEAVEELIFRAGAHIILKWMSEKGDA